MLPVLRSPVCVWGPPQRSVARQVLLVEPLLVLVLYQ